MTVRCSRCTRQRSATVRYPARACLSPVCSVAQARDLGKMFLLTRCFPRQLLVLSCSNQRDQDRCELAPLGCATPVRAYASYSPLSLACQAAGSRDAPRCRSVSFCRGRCHRRPTSSPPPPKRRSRRPVYSSPRPAASSSPPRHLLAPPRRLLADPPPLPTSPRPAASPCLPAARPALLAR